jgi:hypothetical protein
MVIVAKKMQQSVEGQNAQLGASRVPGSPRLAGGDAPRDHDIAEISIGTGRSPGPTAPGSRGGVCRKAQNIGDGIMPAISTVQVMDLRIISQDNTDDASSARRRDLRKPARQPYLRHTPPVFV